MNAAQTSIAATSPVVQLGDGLVGLNNLEPGSVDLVLSDLPSGETAATFDRAPYLPAFWLATWGALKPSGLAVLMASSIRFAAALIASEPKAFRYDLVWSKSIATGFLNSKHRPLRSHEFVLVFCREGASTYHAQMRETGRPISGNGFKGNTLSENYGVAKNRKGGSRAGATDRFPTSILRHKSVSQYEPNRHPQQKPVDLFVDLLRTYSNPGELVVDPCAGSGVTGHACIATGRRCLLWDSDPRFGRAL